MLSNVLYFLLNVAKLVQTHLEVVQEVRHGVVEEVQTIDVKLVNLGSFELIDVIYVLILTFLQNLFRFSNFVLKE